MCVLEKLTAPSLQFFESPVTIEPSDRGLLGEGARNRQIQKSVCQNQL